MKLERHLTLVDGIEYTLVPENATELKLMQEMWETIHELTPTHLWESMNVSLYPRKAVEAGTYVFGATRLGNR